MTRSPASTSKPSSPTTNGKRSSSVDPLIPGPPLRFAFYGGKGGVGKTTCAAARAVAEASAGRRVLAVSTDPAHSLGDALGERLSSTPRRVVGLRDGSLDAVELDAPRAFTRWLKEHRRPLSEILEHGTWLDRDDVDALLDLSIPGVDELVGILEIARLAAGKRNARNARKGVGERISPPASRTLRSGVEGHYDLVVVDTAPTGHTLRLLAAPETVAAVAVVLASLQREHRLIREQLARVGRPEAADRLITLLAAQARETAERLRDPQQTAFHWVTLPEALALAESEDAVAVLERTGMHVSEIVVNRMLPASGRCPVCDRRRVDEQRVLTAIRRRFGRGRRVRVIRAVLPEPRGVRALASLARDIWHIPSAKGRKPSPIDHQPSAISHQPFTEALSLPGDAETIAPESIAAFRGASLLFFGGKGGVGKTTVAAAAALRLARADDTRRVLLLSTDPAHSLADVFKTAIGDAARRIPGAPANLAVRELDAAAALGVRRAQFESALDEIAAAIGADQVAGAGGSGAELMKLAPPGIDELFGVLSVVDARADYDLIVVDTAPTGHALRLLEMPEAAREWVQVLLRVLLKYRSLVRPGQLAAELVDVSKSIRELQTLLRDREQTRFVVVTRAATVPRRETERLLTRLRRLRLWTPGVVVNALTLAPGRCERCRATAAAEAKELAILRRPRGCVIIRTPLSAPAPRGVRALEAFAQKWIPENG
jgi:arsenite/tail-anchored protein-transporting ATPase